MIRRTAAVVLVAALLVSSPAWSNSPGGDAPTCAGRAADIVGTEGNDIIEGTPGDDVIVGLGGHDLIRPGAGDDIVCGGRGSDSVISKRGRDRLYGGPGGDRLEGLSRLPTKVYGGAGNDVLRLSITDEPGYAIQGGNGRDVGDIGKQPKASDSTRVLIDARSGRIVRGGAPTGHVGSIEFVGLDELLPYSYFGTRRPDHVTVFDGVFSFVARTYGGPDTITSAEGDDDIDAGRGDDRVDAGPGHDTCLHAERVRACESTGP